MFSGEKDKRQEKLRCSQKKAQSVFFGFWKRVSTGKSLEQVTWQRYNICDVKTHSCKLGDDGVEAVERRGKTICCGLVCHKPISPSQQDFPCWSSALQYMIVQKGKRSVSPRKLSWTRDDVWIDPICKITSRLVSKDMKDDDIEPRGFS